MLRCSCRRLESVLIFLSIAAAEIALKSGWDLQAAEVKQFEEKEERRVEQTKKAGVTPQSKHLATVVSAFFLLKNSSKYGDAKQYYTEKAKDMLRIKNPVVVHTDVPQMIKDLRRGKENITLIVPYNSVTDLPLYAKYGRKVWEQQVEIDIEREMHRRSFNLHLVWNSKTDFLKQAVENNVFGSEYFLWVDIGCMQYGPSVGDPRYSIAFEQWPDSSALLQIPHDKMVFMAVGIEENNWPRTDPFGLGKETKRMTELAHKLKGWNNMKRVVWRLCHGWKKKEGPLYHLNNPQGFLGGGIFGGHKEAVSRMEFTVRVTVCDKPFILCCSKPLCMQLASIAQSSAVRAQQLITHLCYFNRYVPLREHRPASAAQQLSSSAA
jgi:hypothetical protein